MKIDILKEISFTDLEEMIRSVPLMRRSDSDPVVEVYKNANIGFGEMKRLIGQQSRTGNRHHLAADHHGSVADIHRA